MNRRHLLALPAFVAAGPVHAAMPRVDMALLDGGFDGTTRLAGVALRLADDWKTYWRMPGEAGVAPEFDWGASANLGHADVSYPLPSRFHDGSGDTVGYKHEVVFPLAVSPVDPAAPVGLKLTLFLGACKDICVPLHLAAQTTLAGYGGPDAAALHGWQSRVPVAVPAPAVTASTLALESGKPSLILTLAQPVNDIFVEAPGGAYFRKPDFAEDGLSARLVIDNVKDGEMLRGQTLRLTLDAGGRGLEQSITLA